MVEIFYLYGDYTDCGHLFYVGKGNAGRVRHKRRNQKHTAMRRSHGFTRRILCESENEKLIFELEVMLIALHRLNFHRHGDNPWACNFTDGGEGQAGVTWTTAMRTAMSQRKKGRSLNLTPEGQVQRRRPKSAETRKNMSKPKTKDHAANIGKASKGRQFGPPTEEQRRKNSEGVRAAWARKRSLAESRCGSAR